MRTRSKFIYCMGIVCALVFAAARCASAAVPQLEAGVRLSDGGSAITVDVGYSAPEAVDWNNDGITDLVVGQYAYGKARLYVGQGTSNNPAFNGFSYLTAYGLDITTAYG